MIASDAVGAAAGGLVRDGRNGLVVPAGDSDALAGAIRRLAADPALRAAWARPAREDVQAFTYDAWAQGFSRALASLGLSRRSAGSVRTLERSLAVRRRRYAHLRLARGGGRYCAHLRTHPKRRSPCVALWQRCGDRRARRRRKDHLRCTHGESLSGFTQQDYSKALKELETSLEEYSGCAS